MFQWHIDKFAFGVCLGPGFISTSPLNNTKRTCNQREEFSETPIRKRNQTKNFIEILCPLYFNPRNRKTNKMTIFLVVLPTKFFVLMIGLLSQLLFIEVKIQLMNLLK